MKRKKYANKNPSGALRGENGMPERNTSLCRFCHKLDASEGGL